MLWWLRDVFGALLSDSRIQVLFAAPGGSAFAEPVPTAIERLGGRIIPWSQATSHPFDLAIAPSHRGGLHDLQCPLLITSHGPGFNKLISLPRSRLAPLPAVAPATAAPTTVMLTHRSQRQQWADQPAVRFVEAGDPHWDALAVSLRHRQRYRHALGVSPQQRLVLVTSTWGPNGLFGSDPELIARLLGEVPADDYVVAAVLHPNIWVAHGAWQIRTWLRRPLLAGLRLLEHEAGWAAAIVAADALIGDHGSVTFYGAALGVPVALAAFDDEEVTPGSPMQSFGQCAPRWKDTGAQDALGQLGEFDPGRYADLAEQSFAFPGRSLDRYRDTVYELLDLSKPTWPLESSAVESPLVPRRPVLAHVVCADVQKGADGRVQVNLVRRPAVLAESPDDERDRHLAVDIDVADGRLAQSAAVLVRRSRSRDAVQTARTTLDAFPGARVVAVATETGTVLVTTTGVFDVTAPPDLDPAFAGSCLYAAMPKLDRADETDVTDVALTVDSARPRVTLSLSARGPADAG